MHRGYGYNFVDSPSGLIVPVTADVVVEGLDAKEVAFDLDLPGGSTNYLREDGTWNAPPGTSGGHVIEDEGTPLAQRTNLNFTGAGVTVSDDAGNDQTDVTIPGAGAGTSVKLYDYTVAGADKASIDSNVDGTTVANFAGYDVLEIWMILRTDSANPNANPLITVNNDTSAIYDRDYVGVNNTTQQGSSSNAASSWNPTVHGSGGSASYPGVLRITIPGYAVTTFWKVAELTQSSPDATAGNQYVGTWSLGYRSTSAITRLKVAGAGGELLKIGSRMIVYGR